MIPRIDDDDAEEIASGGGVEEEDVNRKPKDEEAGKVDAAVFDIEDDAAIVLNGQRSKLQNLLEVANNYFPLGYVSFGGPAFHFMIMYDKFVNRLHWIDSQTFSELYAMTNALPAPASTQTAYSIALMHSGIPSGILSFILCLSSSKYSAYWKTY
jgi:hypothetical protein